MKLKPYLSIDIETTGLDSEKDTILEVAAVYDDGISEIKDLKTFRCILQTEYLNGGSPFALALNSELLQEIACNNSECSSCNPTKDLSSWLDNMFYNTELERKPISLAGKNVANFDLKFLLKSGFNYPYKHRIIDVGSLYFADFGYVPSLDEINKFIGNSSVKHKALDDALDVVKSIRAKFK